MALTLEGTQNLGYVSRAGTHALTIPAGTTGVIVVGSGGWGFAYATQPPDLGGLPFTQALDYGINNQSGVGIWYLPSMGGRSDDNLTFPDANNSGSDLYSVLYVSATDLAFDSGDNWGSSCATCRGNVLTHAVSQPAGDVQGRWLAVCAFAGYSGYSSRTASLTAIGTYDGTHHETAYDLQESGATVGWTMPGLGFYGAAGGVVFYDADTDMTVIPDTAVLDVVMPAPTMTVDENIYLTQESMTLNVVMPAPTMVVKYPRQIPLVGRDVEMPGRVPMADGYTTPLLTEAEDIPQWMEGSVFALTEDIPLDNTTATTDPTSTDDVSEGYSVLSRWVNTTSDTVWICADATEGAAVWNTAGPGADGADGAEWFVGPSATGGDNGDFFLIDS